jgi:hypothetical protein
MHLFQYIMTCPSTRKIFLYRQAGVFVSLRVSTDDLRIYISALRKITANTFQNVCHRVRYELEGNFISELTSFSL